MKGKIINVKIETLAQLTSHFQLPWPTYATNGATQIKYCGLSTFPVTSSMSKVMRQAMGKSILPRHCSQHVKGRPIPRKRILRSETTCDTGLKKFSDWYVNTHSTARPALSPSHNMVAG